jgi:hypothetical protein
MHTTHSTRTQQRGDERMLFLPRFIALRFIIGPQAGALGRIGIISHTQMGRAFLKSYEVLYNVYIRISTGWKDFFALVKDFVTPLRWSSVSQDFTRHQNQRRNPEPVFCRVDEIFKRVKASSRAPHNNQCLKTSEPYIRTKGGTMSLFFSSSRRKN